MITGSTARVLQREPLIIGIYPHDVAKIFNELDIPVLFIDQDGNDLSVDKALSGIF